MELVASSGVVGDGYNTVKSGCRTIRQWINRVRGLSILKNLPRGLQALVFGADVTPELFAALSLGGRPGLQLSTIALLTTEDFGFNKGDFGFSRKPRTRQSRHQLALPATAKFVEKTRPTLLEVLFAVNTAPKPPDPNVKPSQMDDGIHEFKMLDGQLNKRLRVHRSCGTVLSLAGNAHVVVVAASSQGLLIYGEADHLYYFCENRFGRLEVSSVDVSPNSINVTGTNPRSKVFIVAPTLLDSYSSFFRLMALVGYAGVGVVGLLGLMKVAKDMGERFAQEITGDGISLLSSQHLRNVHTRLGEGRPAPQMPTDTELRSMVQEASESLPLSDRNFELALFGTMQEITSAYVEAVERIAAKPGNVGVVPYTKKDESLLIKSSVVQAVGMEPAFAIFEPFRKHKLNVAISRGCTAVYFPGLSLTLAFAEGFDMLENALLRPACPFTDDMQESLSILVALAPTLAQGKLRTVAKTLSSELSKNPSLALSPLTEKVARSFSAQGRPSRFYLSKLFASVEKCRPENPFGEASVAGVLCQLGMSFSVPQVNDPCDLRCFFNCCREVWRPRCTGGEVIVDCGVDISGCLVGEVGRDLFLSYGDYYFKLTGPRVNVPWDEWQPSDDYHHLKREPHMRCFGPVGSTRIPVRCYVGSPTTIRHCDLKGSALCTPNDF